MAKLPDFLIVGAGKAGTSWLYDCFREHPNIYVPLAYKDF